MPLTNVQVEALKVIAATRDPESYIAGSTPLNRTSPRYSTDIDIFHDREDAVHQAAERDAAALAASGFSLRWLRRNGGMYSLVASRGGEDVKLEWIVDSDFRFFPVAPHAEFGFALHPVDLALNKVIAAANRRELRDIVDLVEIDKTILPLGALVWAAVEKAPGFTPEGLIEEIRRNSIHPAEEWRALATDKPLIPERVLDDLRTALTKARDFITQMPTERAGLLFLSGETPVQPDPCRLQDYAAHSGRRRGHWPSTSQSA